MECFCDTWWKPLLLHFTHNWPQTCVFEFEYLYTIVLHVGWAFQVCSFPLGWIYLGWHLLREMTSVVNCESSHVENCLNELSPGVSFAFIKHYLWNPQPLLVQYIGNINKFLWLSVFWLLCSNALELVHMKETHLKLLGMSVVGISQISAIYPLTYSQQLYLLLFMRHIALAHQITSHCLWDLVISCEFLQTICWSSFQVLVGTFSMHFEFLMKFSWCW